MKNKTIATLMLIALLLCGVLIKTYYISYTETWERQHDVIGFGADEGHAAYIEYILDNKKLPDFDPREKWGFFQPPLHHIVSAVAMDVSENLGADEHRAQENTQVVTCIEMILVMLMSVWMFLNAKGITKFIYSHRNGEIVTEGIVVMLSIVGLHPIFTLMSGSINNDALALTLSMVSLVLAVKWYDDPDYIVTLLMAISIGCAMLAKLTGGLVAVPIGILMVLKLFGFDGGLRDDGHAKVTFFDHIKFFFKKYLLKSALFAVVVVPLGLSFGIKNKIKWDMPLNYIPPVGENFPDSITLKNRLFDIKTSSVYTFLTTRGDSFDEYNIPLAMVKTSLFGEYNYSDVSRWMRVLAPTVFVTGIILILIALIATAYMMLSKKSRLSLKWKIILFGTWATYLMAYLYFAFTNRNFSAQDFRYAAICIVCEGIFTGLFVDTVNNKKIKYSVMAIGLVFALASLGTYLLLGFKS